MARFGNLPLELQIKILYDVYTPDEGSIFVHQTELLDSTPETLKLKPGPRVSVLLVNKFFHHFGLEALFTRNAFAFMHPHELKNFVDYVDHTYKRPLVSLIRTIILGFDRRGPLCDGWTVLLRKRCLFQPFPNLNLIGHLPFQEVGGTPKAPNLLFSSYGRNNRNLPAHETFIEGLKRCAQDLKFDIGVVKARPCEQCCEQYQEDTGKIMPGWAAMGHPTGVMCVAKNNEDNTQHKDLIVLGRDSMDDVITDQIIITNRHFRQHGYV